MLNVRWTDIYAFTTIAGRMRKARKSVKLSYAPRGPHVVAEMRKYDEFMI